VDSLSRKRERGSITSKRKQPAMIWRAAFSFSEIH